MTILPGHVQRDMLGLLTIDKLLCAILNKVSNCAPVMRLHRADTLKTTQIVDSTPGIVVGRPNLAYFEKLDDYRFIDDELNARKCFDFDGGNRYYRC